MPLSFHPDCSSVGSGVSAETKSAAVGTFDRDGRRSRWTIRHRPRLARYPREWVHIVEREKIQGFCEQFHGEHAMIIARSMLRRAQQPNATSLVSE
jgi:hypothetical protein